MKHYSLFQCQLLASGLQVEFRKAPLLHPLPSACKFLCDPGGDVDREELGFLGEQTWGAARWSLVVLADMPCAVTADRTDTISSLLAEQNTGTWCVSSCVTLLGLGLQGVVPLAYMAAALGSALPLPAHLKPHKIKTSCKFTVMCPGNCPLLPCWRSPGPFPGALPISTCSKSSPASLGAQSLAPPVNLTGTYPAGGSPGGQGLPTLPKARRRFRTGQ